MPETKHTECSVADPLDKILARLKGSGGDFDARAKQLDAHEKARAEQNRAASLADALKTLTNRLGPRYSPERVLPWEKFIVYEQSQEMVLSEVKEYAGSLAERAALGEGMVLYGDVGSGKDHLIAALLYTAIKAGHMASWVNCQDLYGRMRDRMTANQVEEEVFRELSRPVFLALSDPTPSLGEMSGWQTQLLYRLIDRRYHELRPTLVTMNAHSIEDIDRELTPRVWDRLQDCAMVLRCDWQSYRERRKR